MAATVDVDGATCPRRRACTPCRRTRTTPRSGPGRWDGSPRWLAAVDGPAVVAGDFNATADHRQFRDILGERASPTPRRRSGRAGCRRTRPTGGGIPLLVAIDHVLSSDGIVATDVERVDIAGTDHAALVVRLAVRRTVTAAGGV